MLFEKVLCIIIRLREHLDQLETVSFLTATIRSAPHIFTKFVESYQQFDIGFCDQCPSSFMQEVQHAQY